MGISKEKDLIKTAVYKEPPSPAFKSLETISYHRSNIDLKQPAHKVFK
jgi:hypothetical protein